MSQEHYLPLFVGDFLASTATWTGPERGLYLQLLAFQWTSGPLPCDQDRLALVLHYEPKEFRRLWPVMSGKFKNGDGALTNPRLEAVRAKNAEVNASRIARATAASNARWNAPSIAKASSKESPNDPCVIPSDPIRSDPNPILPEPRGERARAARPPPRKRCPIEFQITDDLRTWAQTQAPDVDVDRETERMRDWEFKTGRSDWPATWRTWMDRAQKELAERPGRRRPARAPKTPEQIEAEAADAQH